jgi:crotonobetainyl-CoA:carnitine CoA-transferase CaiB-like acyl-CoA transferase
MTSPLEGIRVLDFTRVLSGPHCTRMLTDLGADVIKVEPKQGDLTRFFMPRVNSLALYFIQQNVGKRNISVDIEKPEGVELLLKVVPHVDVVVENNRPGVMDRIGLGYERMRELNPKLIFASITGYGQKDVPWRDRPAYAPTVHADMGLLHTVARARGVDPFHDPYSHADQYSGMQCITGILAALVHRERCGEGTRVDVSMAESTLFATELLAMQMARPEEDRPPNPLDGRSAIFHTREGHFVTVAGDPTPRGTFQSWCRAMEREDLGDDPRFVDDATRRKNRQALLDVIQEWILTFDDLEVLDKAMQRGRLVLGVIRSVPEAVATPWAEARGAVVHVTDRGDGTVHVPNTPWRFDGLDTGVRGEPAYRGEHNREVFAQIAGLSESELDELEAGEVLLYRGPSERDR